MIKELLMDARASKASDVHISEGFPLYFRINGVLQQVRSLSAEASVKCIKELIPDYYQDKAYTDLDFAYEDSNGRYRVNVFHHGGKLGATIRLLSENIPTLEELKLPKVLAELANKQRGLILITGPT
ncbi:MAG: type IV pili twitching motility protein PilT, partial [Erysipelotrichaceae bacterium]|nr:type IV pili twitching motility protein PilT [Erysipelotrichaceae bacterium]